MRFSVRVNNDLAFAELLALAEAAERAGFDQLWVSNDLFLRSAPVLAGALAARTGRIGLGIAVMNPYSVHVSELAMARRDGAGGQRRPVPARPRGRRGAVPRLGRDRQDAAAGHVPGRRWPCCARCSGTGDVDASLLPEWFGPDSVPAGSRWPRPVPVYVGAMGPKMLEMAGAGTRTACCRCCTRPNAIPRCGSRCWRARRRPASRSTCRPASGSRCPTTRRRRRAALAEKLAYYGPSISGGGARPGRATARRTSGRPPASARRAGGGGAHRRPMLALGVAGDAADVLARCRALRRLGAKHLSFGPPLGTGPGCGHPPARRGGAARPDLGGFLMSASDDMELV